MKLAFYNHSGYYGDGNGCYDTINRTINLGNGTITTETTRDYYGQLSSNGHHSQITETETRELVTLDADTQREIWRVLEPLVSTYNKYPHLSQYRYFSRRHRYLIEGRFNKARKLAGDSDLLQHDSAKLWTWILPAIGVVVHAHVARDYWACYTESIEED